MISRACGNPASLSFETAHEISLSNDFCIFSRMLKDGMLFKPFIPLAIFRSLHHFSIFKQC